MVTAIQGGVQVKLGAISEYGLATQVKASAVQSLLKEAAASAPFKLAQGRLEFRLLQRDGQAVLQLKERNWASQLKSCLGIGSEVRAQQRQLAMQGINRAYGLGLNLTGQEATGQQMRQFMDTQAPRLQQLDQAQAQGALGLGVADRRTPDQTLDGLSRMQHMATTEGEVQDHSEPLASLFDKKVFGTLTRSNVAISEAGELHIGGPRTGGSAGANLETVVKFVENKTGLSREDPQFKPVLRHLTRCDHFVFASQLNTHYSLALTEKFGVTAFSLNMVGRSQISFADGAFTVQQKGAGSILMGNVDLSLEDAFRASQAIEVTQSFRLNVQDLAQPQFDIGRAAQDLQYQENF